jgi:NADH dehydrogenase
VRVLITGGCGFLGAASARALRAAGHEVRLLSRRRAGEWRGFPVVQGDVRDPASLGEAAAGVEAAVLSHQFPGFPIERPAARDTFRDVDADGTRHVLQALKAHGRPRRVIYLSGAAVRAEAAGQHPGIDAKLDAERHVRGSDLPWTILRASVVYGPGDHSFSRLAGMIARWPAVPVPGDGRPLSAPIHIDDLARAVAAALEDPRAADARLDACGPDTLSTDAILDLLMQALGRRRPVLHLPLGPLNLVAALLERLPRPPLTRGLIAFSRMDNASHGVNADAALGLTFRTVDAGVRQVYGRGEGVA